MCCMNCLNQCVNMFILIQPEGCGSHIAPGRPPPIRWEFIFLLGNIMNGGIKYSVTFIHTTIVTSFRRCQ